MLSNFVLTERGRRRHLATRIGPYLDGYLAHRQARGFAAATIATNLKWATALGEYLASEGSTAVSKLGEDVLASFEEHIRCHPRLRGPKRRTPEGSRALTETLRGSLRSLLAYLRAIGAAPSAPARNGCPHDAVLLEYLSFLRMHRGFAETTTEQHRRCGSAFLTALGQRRPMQSLAEVSVDDIERIAVTLADGLGRRSRQIMTTTIESLLRYLRSAGHVPQSCAPFLPRMKTYALSSLPSVIPWRDVERAIEGIGRSSPMGLRDHALLLLTATYGLRAAETVGLRLDDIDWRRGVLHVRQTKTRHTLDLPLVPPVRDALIAYLRQGRPATSERHVFVKCHAPRGPVTRATLYAVVRKTLRGAGIEAAHYGPHSLRHARATALIRGGHSIKVIGDLLGHRVPEATLIYCKLAVEDLRAVALDLPEVGS